ncbi:MAG: hypothetical protein FWD54_04605 [Endomicrobia bacterium]|nr:hypothetical protein [Endomicrobiia bacterium]MCL2799534.1 hypothetical protein [Endomicrobiia bacterium]
MKKKIKICVCFALFFLFSVVLHKTVFAANKIPASNIFILNYDAGSQAMGGTLASFSLNSLGFTANPSSNFSVLSKRLDFSGIAAYGGLYGTAGALMLPLEYGNLTIGGTYDRFDSVDIITPDGKALSSDSSVFINFVLPFSTEVPVYADKGGLGLTVKGYQLSASDTSKMVFTADLGVHYTLGSFISGLWAFVALKNLGSSVEITGAESFEIPASFNFALRYEIPVSPLGIAFTGDVMKFFSYGTGVAAGVEISPVYPVTFKAGYRDLDDEINEGFTAGMFLNFDSFNIGYSFSAMAEGYDAYHLVSLGFMFGGVTDDKKAFDYYLGSNFNKAKEYYDKRDFINARQEFEKILAIYPNHAPSKEYLKKIIYDLDIYERNLELQVNKYLRRADLELHRDNLIKARDYYYRVLSIEPENAEAEAGLSELSKKLYQAEIRANRKKYEKEIIQLWNEAIKLFDEGNFVASKDKFREILDIDPENAGALKYMSTINVRISKINSMQADKLFTQGMEYYNMADYDRAAKHFSAVHTADPNRADAKEYYELSKKALNIAYSEETEKNAKSAQAQSKQKQVTRLADKDDSVLSSNQKIQKEMERYYNQAVDYFNNGRYEEALRAFVSLREKSIKNSYYDLNQSIKDYSNKAREAIAEGFYREGQAFVKQGKFDEALVKFTDAINYNPKFQSAIKEKENVSAALAQQYYDAGLKAYSSGNRKKAVELMEKALEYNPNRTDVAKTLERIKFLGGL